ncbi:MAG: glycosyltransferase family 4 protein, partial [bacterium]
LIFRNADRILVLSSQFKSKLRERGFDVPVDVETTTVDEDLLEGFDLDTALKERKRADQDHILFLSRLIEEKGIREFLESLRLLKQWGREFKATVAGDGPRREWMENTVEEMGLRSRVDFPGYLTGDSKREIYQRATLYCLPSHEEGMPNSVLEAMAFGLPVVSTPVGGLEDLFETVKFGEIVPVGESESLATAMSNCGIESQTWERTARRNYQHARQRFLAPSVADRLSSYYGRILSR